FAAPWLHRSPLKWVVVVGQAGVDDVSNAAAMARQTRSGVNGRSMWRTPSGASASSTAFCTAAVDPMAPAWPMPFAPIGLIGDAMLMVDASIAQISAALGTR